jgi:hypothetical protein
VTLGCLPCAPTSGADTPAGLVSKGKVEVETDPSPAGEAAPLVVVVVVSAPLVEVLEDEEEEDDDEEVVVEDVPELPVLVAVAVVVVDEVVDDVVSVAAPSRTAASCPGTSATSAGEPRFTAPSAGGSPVEPPARKPPAQRAVKAATISRARRNKGVYCPRREAVRGE